MLTYFIRNKLITKAMKGDPEVTQPVYDIYSMCQKKGIVFRSENNKQYYVKRWKCPPLSTMREVFLSLRLV
jgi:hypothetical protein